MGDLVWVGDVFAVPSGEYITAVEGSECKVVRVSTSSHSKTDLKPSEAELAPLFVEMTEPIFELPYGYQRRWASVSRTITARLL